MATKQCGVSSEVEYHHAAGTATHDSYVSTEQLHVGISC
jgi:hypothetical protein